MANFPTDWEVHSDEKFNMFDMDATFDTALGMNTLLKVGADGRSTGVYKLYLFGGGTMESRYKLEDFIYNLPDVFEGLYIKSILKAPRVSPGQNSCSTPWRDFDVLLLEKALFLVNEDDDVLDPKEGAYSVSPVAEGRKIEYGSQCQIRHCGLIRKQDTARGPVPTGTSEATEFKAKYSRG